MGKRTNIQDVALAAGVSKSSISNYLNGHSERLSEATIRHIRQVMEVLEYSPSLGARSLSTKAGARTFGAILRHDLGYAFNTQFFPLVMRGISEVCTSLGYRLLIVSSMGRSQQNDVDYALSLGQGIVDGFLVFEIEENDPYVTAFTRKKIPHVCFGVPSDKRLTSWVASDQEGGIYQAVVHLWQHGHRRIALFPGQANLLITMHRVEGYRRAVQAMGGAWDPDLVQFSFSPESDPFPDYARILAAPDFPKAFIIPHFHTTAYFRALEQTGRTEAGIALVLADYFPSGHETVCYSHLNSHIHQVGARGAAKLIDIVSGKPGTGPDLFPVELVIGNTCGCKQSDSR